MTRMTLEEFHAALRAQEPMGIKTPQAAYVRCPRCGTLQCLNDFVEMGVEVERAEKLIAFSCIGRIQMERGEKITHGCDWTLGGLFAIHELVVVTKDGEEHPAFMPATCEEIKEALAKGMELTT